MDKLQQLLEQWCIKHVIIFISYEPSSNYQGAFRTLLIIYDGGLCENS